MKRLIAMLRPWETARKHEELETAFRTVLDALTTIGDFTRDCEARGMDLDRDVGIARAKVLMEEAKEEARVRSNEFYEVRALLEREAPRLLYLLPQLEGPHDPHGATTRAAMVSKLIGELLAEAIAPEKAGPGPRGSGRKAATVNMRMMDQVQNNSESMGWSTSQWQRFLKCKSRSTIAATATWKNLSRHRLGLEAERRKSKRRR